MVTLLDTFVDTLMDTLMGNLAPTLVVTLGLEMVDAPICLTLIISGCNVSLSLCQYLAANVWRPGSEGTMRHKMPTFLTP